jgi:hypothetical protein
MTGFEVRRVAADGSAGPKASPAELEIQAILDQDRRFRNLMHGAVIVSFVHMATTLLLFSGESWYDQLSGFFMTMIIDFTIIYLAMYIDYARRRGYSRSRWVYVTFGASLLLSVGLNGAYMWSHRPPATKVPEIASGAISVLFAIFVPLVVGISSLIRGELHEDRLGLEREASAKAADEELRRERREERRRPQPIITPIPTEPASKALERDNEAAPRMLPDTQATDTIDVSRETLPAAARRPGNGKSKIMTNDVATIAKLLREQGVTKLRSGAHLNSLMGWTSSSSGTKAIEELREGLPGFVVDAVGGGYDLRYEVIFSAGEAGTNTLDSMLDALGVSRERAAAMLRQYQLTDPERAFSTMKSRLPKGLDYATFARHHAELLS